MRPALEALADGEERSTATLRAALAERFSLTAADLEEEIPSGEAKTFPNRVDWALTYLDRARLVECPTPSTHRLTEHGRQAMAEYPERIDMRILSRIARRR